MDRRLLSLLTILALGRVGYAAGPEVEYPSGFRQWAHVKSMVIYSDKHPLFGQFGGFHSVYVNPKGLPAMTKGGSFPDGSVLVFDLLEAREENGAYVEGSRKLIGVMVKDRQRYKVAGGWGFEAFKGDSRTERTVTDATAECFACHQKQKANDFVYSGFRP
ncbi:MAG: cytochrome C [Deltaproteobacteria bacterium]|nr:MAG: cytochrome C [Deltaproteobacteria bacterium]